MRDRAQLPAEPKNIHVKAYYLINNNNDYDFLGEGSLEIVTDTDMIQSQHYIQITNEVNKEIFLRSRLLSTNDYERQKSTVILWNDPEQQLSNYLAMSFESQDLCDMIWRLICSKIGKNYLQINGRQKLDMPNQKNIRSIKEKIKNSYNLVAYHVINSQAFMSALWETLINLDKKHDELSGISILRDLFSHFDPKIMQIFLSDPNFEKFLGIYESINQIIIDECKINFKAYYKKSMGTNQLVQISNKVRKNIEMALRAKFVKDCVIDYAKDSMLENMLTQVIKQNEVEALISLLQQDVIVKIINVYQQSKKQLQEQQYVTVRKIITFFLQCVWTLRIHHADNTKIAFLHAFYSNGMLPIVGQFLSHGFYKALQILSCLVILDNTQFFNEFMNDYRNNSGGKNLIRIINKQFSESPHVEFVDQTINFIKALSPFLLADNKLFQFINKTLLIAIFSSCKIIERLLSLIVVCLCQLNAAKATFDHIIKFNLLRIVTGKLSTNQLNKKSIINVIKILKIILEINLQQSYKISENDLNKINSYIVDSNIFNEILKFFKQSTQSNNMIISSIITLFVLISQCKYNQFVKAVQQFDFGYILAKPHLKHIGKYLQKIIKIQSTQFQKTMLVSQFDIIRKKHHRMRLEEEQEQQYLQQEQKQEEIKPQQKTKDQNQVKKQDMEMNMRSLLEMREEIGNKNKFEQRMGETSMEQLKDRTAKLKAKKKQEENIQFSIQGIDDF